MSVGVVTERQITVPESLKSAVLEKVFLHRFDRASDSSKVAIGSDGEILAALASAWVEGGYEPITGHLKRKLSGLNKPVVANGKRQLISLGCLYLKADQKLDLTSKGFRVVWEHPNLRSALPNLPIQPDLNFSVIHLDSRHSFLTALRILSDAVSKGGFSGPVKITQIAELLDWDKDATVKVAKKLFGSDIALNPTKDGLILTDSGNRSLNLIETAKAAPRQSKMAQSDLLKELLPALIYYVITHAEKSQGLTLGEIERASSVFGADWSIGPTLVRLVKDGVLKKEEKQPDPNDRQLKRFHQPSSLYTICNPDATYPQPENFDFSKLDFSRIFKAFGHSGNFHATRNGEGAVIESDVFIGYLRAMGDGWFEIKDFKSFLRAIHIKFDSLELMRAMTHFANHGIIEHRKSEKYSKLGKKIVRFEYRCLPPERPRPANARL